MTQQSDARQVGADIVVQVGGDACSHVGHLEQTRDAIPVQRIDHQADGKRDQRQKPGTLPERTQDREGDGCRISARDAVGVHRTNDERVTARGKARVGDRPLVTERAPVAVGPFESVLVTQHVTRLEAEADEINLQLVLL